MKKETEENFYKTLEYYKKNKSKMNDEEKAKYLKVLYPLSSKFNVNLRSELSSNEVLTNLLNPLDNEEFIKSLLIDRYNNCSFDVEILCDITEPSEFDSSKYQSELIEEINKVMPDFNNIEDNTNYYKDHIGNNIFYKSNPIYKISLNTYNNDETYQFLNKYIIKCLEKKLNYDLYGYINEPKNAHTYLYIDENELQSKLDIIKEILPTKLGNAPLCESVNGNYSISHLGILDNDNEIISDYNTYFNEIAEVAYYRVLAKLIVNIVRTEEDEETINHFISLDNIEFKESNSPLNATYNKKTIQEVKDVVNRYIPDITNTIKIYFENDDEITKLIQEFRKSMTYISNLCQNKEIKSKTNIAINTKKI